MTERRTAIVTGAASGIGRAIAQRFAYGPTIHADLGGTGTTVGQGTTPPPITPGPGGPLPNELARERYHAAFSGPRDA